MHMFRHFDALSKAHASSPPPGGGRKTRHELAPRAACAERLTQVGGANSFGASGGGVCRTLTPARNAIGLSRPTACVAPVADGRLSPWRSVLLYPSRAVRGVYVAGRAKWSVAQRSVPCRATARCNVKSRTEPIRREQPIVLCDPITRGGHVPRWIGRDRCPVGSPRRKCDPRSERQYRDRRGSRWLAVSNGEPT